MKIESVSLSLLKENPKNCRKHPVKQIEEMKKSITMFGQTRAVIVDEKNVILAGHCFVLAARELGKRKVDVCRIRGLSEEKKVKLLLADNRLTMMAVEDYGMVMKVVGELSDYDIPGYDAEVFAELLVGGDAALSKYGQVDDTDAGQGADFLNKSLKNIAKIEGHAAAHGNDEGNLVICPHCGEGILIDTV